MTARGAPRALLWDNDGVLVDSEVLFLQASREILARYHPPTARSHEIIIVHSVLVARLAHEIARTYLERHAAAELDLPFILEATLLHDIGKITMTLCFEESIDLIDNLVDVEREEQKEKGGIWVYPIVFFALLATLVSIVKLIQIFYDFPY